MNLSGYFSQLYFLPRGPQQNAVCFGLFSGLSPHRQNLTWTLHQELSGEHLGSHISAVWIPEKSRSAGHRWRVTETAEVYSELTDWVCRAGSEWAGSGSPISRPIGCSCWPTPSRFHSPTSWPAACWVTCSDRRTNSALHKINMNHQLTIKNPRITWQTLCPWCLSPSRTAQTAPPSARWRRQKQLLSLGQFQKAAIEGFLRQMW